VRWPSAAAIRAEIARAIPLYAGIERLSAKGDQFQWGGPTLYADGRFATADGKAHFAAIDDVSPAHAAVMAFACATDPVRTFRVSTRRGKQFNSMVQRAVDPLTGARRDDILISREDLTRLGLTDGTTVVLRAAAGSYRGRLKASPITPGNLEVHWPEGNVLLAAAAIDHASMEPDYNAVVTLEAASAPDA
jgi:predicted molibdopterin-dependent oxidoreductase YjgC